MGGGIRRRLSRLDKSPDGRLTVAQHVPPGMPQNPAEIAVTGGHLFLQSGRCSVRGGHSELDKVAGLQIHLAHGDLVTGLERRDGVAAHRQERRERSVRCALHHPAGAVGRDVAHPRLGDRRVARAPDRGQKNDRVGHPGPPRVVHLALERSFLSERGR